jgi:crossover junction endodeoxyribonuclease RuvC
MKRYIGIDPGLSGAVAVLPEGWIFDTPTAIVSSGKRQRREYLEAEMAAMLAPFVEDSVAAIEKVHAMPRQGVASMFTMGVGLGVWRGILAALGIPFDLVTPQRWKAVMMDGMGKEKEAARTRALQLFPGLTPSLRLKKHHGRAEALLIAEYRRRLEGSA